MNARCSKLYQDARQALEAKDIDQAESLFREVLTYCPDSHEARFARIFLAQIMTHKSPELQRQALRNEFEGVGKADRYFVALVIGGALLALLSYIFLPDSFMLITGIVVMIDIFLLMNLCGGLRPRACPRCGEPIVAWLSSDGCEECGLKIADD